MKRLLLIATAIICFITANAQWRYGIRLGGAISTASVSNVPDYTIKRGSGFSGGIAFEYQHEKTGWAADAALLYTRSGFSLKNDITSLHTCNNYIHIPVNVKYKFWLANIYNLAAPFIYTGPDIMIGLDKTNSATIGTDRLQPGWNIGIGFDIVNFVQIQAGYRFALTNSAKQSRLFPTAKFRNDHLNISATILFDF